MLIRDIDIQTGSSQDYAHMTLYIQHDTDQIPIHQRGIILILPGGAYAWTSPREGEPVALAFAARGYHTAILWYSTAPSVFPTALQETARAVTALYRNAAEWHIDPERIVLLGFSAGGHLAASYACFWNRRDLIGSTGFAGDERHPDGLLKPAGLILGYPVITSDPSCCHQGSIANLLGDMQNDPELLRLVSLEHQAGSQVPPTFLWNTAADESVPPENSLLFANALLKAHVPVEYHLYQKGGHGLSLASPLTDSNAHDRHEKECESWVDLCTAWLAQL